MAVVNRPSSGTDPDTQVEGLNLPEGFLSKQDVISQMN
jgi:hypothetical protein